MSVVIDNPGTTDKTITVRSSTDYVVPAGKSTTVTLKAGDEIILPA